MAKKTKESKKAEPKKEVKEEPKAVMVKVMRLNPKTGARVLMEVEEADVLLSQNGDTGMKDIRV